MTNYSLFHVIAHDEQGDAIKQRKVAVASKQRLDSRYGAWLAAAVNGEDLGERWNYVSDEALGLVEATAQEFESDVRAPEILHAYISSFVAHHNRNEKTAAVQHEARKPRMCPFHKDVVDISLAAQDARAGFDSMAQHWGGPRHCEGDGYEGDKCKFRAEMTTQSYWDGRAEKAQERKDQRQQLEEQEQQIQETDQIEGQPDLISEPTEEGIEYAEPIDDGDGVIEETPMNPVEEAELIHASTKTADGGPVPVMDKRKWTPREFDEPLDVDDADGPNPTKHKDILVPIKPINSDQRNKGKKPDEIGEQVTEHQDVGKDSNPSETARKDQGGTFSNFLSNDEIAQALQRRYK